MKDRPAGFVEFFGDFHRRNPIRDIQIVRSFEDGHYVFLHVLQTLNNGEFRYVTADIFDTDDDAKLIEHWDMIAEIVGDTLSGHGQVDGPTEPADLDRTEENKVLVEGFVNDVLKNGETDKLAGYISADTYIEHNPKIGGGLAVGLRGLAEEGNSMFTPRSTTSVVRRSVWGWCRDRVWRWPGVRRPRPAGAGRGLGRLGDGWVVSVAASRCWFR